MKSFPVVEASDIVMELGHGAGRVKALKGVDVKLFTGELTLLMGPSGSGKTTLLSILGCILSPTAGTLAVAGEPTRGLKPEALAALRRRHICFPTLTAIENVQLALDVRGVDRRSAAEMAEKALTAVGLAHRLRSYPRTMSGGEQQRTAIARAIAGSPSLVLADEPTAALDSENGQAVMALLLDLARDKSRAVLAVTHDARTVKYADRIITIEDGRITGDRRQKAEPVARPPVKSRRKEGARSR
jgi:putative ABC transport system ATP-binding protein